MLFVIKTWIHPAMRHQEPTVKSASINKEKRKGVDDLYKHLFRNK